MGQTNRRKERCATAAERRRLRSEAARLEAETARRVEERADELDRRSREVERLTTEDSAAAAGLLRHDEMLVRAYRDPSPLDWEGKLAVHGYDGERREAARSRAELAALRAREAVDGLVSLRNWVSAPACRARDLRLEAHEAAAPSPRALAAARERKAKRDAAIDRAIREAARAKKRSNPSLSNSRIAEILSAVGVVVTLPGEDDPIVVTPIGPKRIGRALVGG